MILNAVLFIAMTGAICAAFLVSEPAAGLGDLVRAIYFHIGCAMATVIAFLTACVHSVGVLRGGGDAQDIRAESAARLGLVFCAIATITGSILAKNTWGTYWNWDPRETSIVILMLIYLAYFALRAAVEDQDKRSRLAAVYAILAFVTVPFLVFIAPRITEGLHPSPIIPTKRQATGMDSQMRLILMLTGISFILLFAKLQSLSVRAQSLILKKQEEDDAL
jgi:heme exporter protein C